MFAAGVCYGLNIPFVRIIHDNGFATAEIMVLQYIVGVTTLGIIVVLFFRRKISLKAVLRLLGVGVLAAGVSFSYYQALALLPSATAVTLLFQFVWMGVVWQVIRERKLPPLTTIISMFVIMAGTVLATGIVGNNAGELASLDPLGLFFGLLSAAFYTAFLIASGKAANELPAANRTLFTSLGSLIIALILCPTFFHETLAPNITNTGFILPGIALGIFGILLPVFLIASSSPHLPSGLATIMASSELPSGILCAMLFMGDVVSPLIVLGVVIILVGIVLSQSSELLSYLKNRRLNEKHEP